MSDYFFDYSIAMPTCLNLLSIGINKLKVFVSEWQHKAACNQAFMFRRQSSKQQKVNL